MNTDVESLGRYYFDQLTRTGIYMPDSLKPESFKWLHRTGIARVNRYAKKVAGFAVSRSLTPTFDLLREVSDLDHQLRVHALSGVSIFELALKAHLARHFVARFGEFGHLNAASWEARVEATSPRQLVSGIQGAISRGRASEKVQEALPLHDAIDDLPMGTVSLMFQMVPREISLVISRELGLNSYELAVSATRALTHLRNACAHNVPLWQATAVLTPKLPKGLDKGTFGAFSPHSYVPFFLSLNQQIFAATGDFAFESSLKSLLSHSNFYRDGLALIKG